MLIDATGGSRWIGGLYYKRNIIFSLLQNEHIKHTYKLIVVTEKENKSVFGVLEPYVSVHYIRYKYQKERILKIWSTLLFNRCNYMFPCSNENLCRKFGVTGIFWIPDFQHYHLPEFFNADECKNRENTHAQIAKSDFPLVLSSRDCETDFRKYCSSTKEKVYVVPFVSYIEPEIRSITEQPERNILEKYELQGRRYVFIANQFWKHKNHKIVFEAIGILRSKCRADDICFVFTGKMQDHKAPDYIDELKAFYESAGLEQNCKILGFIDRVDQLVLMKNAEFLIQPSLFEGWGTVVEDAKVLDKTILLSDIPVHREQMNNKCVLFDPYNPGQLAELIASENEKAHIDDFEKGIADMYVRAEAYSGGFEQLLKDTEN